MFTRKHLSAVAALALGLGLLAGCAGDDEAQPVPTVTVTVTETATPEPTPEPDPTEGPGDPVLAFPEEDLQFDQSIPLADVEFTPAPAREDGGIPIGIGGIAGVNLTSGVPEIAIYLDYRCPACYWFEHFNLDLLTEFVTNGNALVVVHPVGMLGWESARVAAASAWVAANSPEYFFDYHVALFELRFDETNPMGDDAASLAQIARIVGVPDVVAAGIASGEAFATYGQWAVSNATSFLTTPGLENADGGRGTPTIAINGERWDGNWQDPAALAAAVEAAGN
jgi:protein-disulfide isomerase